MHGYFQGLAIYRGEPIPASGGSGIGFRGRLRVSRGGGCLGLLRLFSGSSAKVQHNSMPTILGVLVCLQLRRPYSEGGVLSCGDRAFSLCWCCASSPSW
jgi:hypothetical protein